MVLSRRRAKKKTKITRKRSAGSSLSAKEGEPIEIGGKLEEKKPEARESECRTKANTRDRIDPQEGGETTKLINQCPDTENKKPSGSWASPKKQIANWQVKTKKKLGSFTQCSRCKTTKKGRRILKL